MTTLIQSMVPPTRKAKKEAKRQRSEPSTPISTSSRLPYEYDQVMGITQVGSGEPEGFEEGNDLAYHDAAEPNVLELEENTREAVLSHGGCGSSSHRECIEVLNNPQRKSPATCHSGPKMENRSGPPQLLAFVVLRAIHSDHEGLQLDQLRVLSVSRLACIVYNSCRI